MTTPRWSDRDVWEEYGTVSLTRIIAYTGGDIWTVCEWTGTRTVLLDADYDDHAGRAVSWQIDQDPDATHPAGLGLIDHGPRKW